MVANTALEHPAVRVQLYPSGTVTRTKQQSQAKTKAGNPGTGAFRNCWCNTGFLLHNRLCSKTYCNRIIAPQCSHSVLLAPSNRQQPS